MPSLKIIKTSQSDFNEKWNELLKHLSLESALLGNTDRLSKVRQIIEKVRTGGDAAISNMTREFDGVELAGQDFRIPQEQLKLAHENMDPDLLTALRESIANVRDYQEKISINTPDNWTNDGATLGVRYTPIRRAGLCIPGASAPLVSTVIMTAVPAQVAGVEEIAVISSPSYQGSIHPSVLGLCYELNISEVYRISGAQAVAALAFGTETIKKVDKVVGPSSWWGQLAKKELYGLIDIDSFAGPSEVLVLADESGSPNWIAADMLSQAEHDPGSAILVTDSDSLAQAVVEKVDQQLKQLSRSEGTQRCIEAYSAIVVTDNFDQAIDITNDFAVEHLQIQCKDNESVLNRIENAGAIFIGDHTPVAVGDYFAGPSHTLPTGSSAKFFGALNVNDFKKQTSIIQYNRDALKRSSQSICKIADAEGLDAHANSVQIRVDE